MAFTHPPARPPTLLLQPVLRSPFVRDSVTGGTDPDEPMSLMENVTLDAPLKGWKPVFTPQPLIHTEHTSTGSQFDSNLFGK